MQTLIVFFGAIGDTILFAPAIHKLSLYTRISVIGYPERMALLKKVNWIEKIYDPDAIEFYTLFSTPSEKLQKCLTAFNKIYLFLRDADVIAKTLKKLGIPEVYCFAGKPPEDWKLHASYYYFQCLGFPFQPTETFLLPISPSKKHNEIIIHPGSGSPSKNISIDFFEMLTQQLQRLNYTVRWCLGPAEEKISIPHNISILHIETLTKLAEYIAGAYAFIGNDSGITHLAGALGVKTIALFQSTNPAIWHPLGPQVHIFTTENMSLEKIIDVIFGNERK